jgi:hypothetical protein
MPLFLQFDNSFSVIGLEAFTISGEFELNFCLQNASKPAPVPTDSMIGFFLNDFQELSNKLNHCVERDIPVLLLGVTFALLDFAEKYFVHLFLKKLL